MRILLLTPPMTQLNTPYPATAYLTGFLRMRGFEVEQADPALELILRLFSKPGLMEIKKELEKSSAQIRPPGVRNFLAQTDAYFRAIEPTIVFLQGNDPSLALRIIGGEYLPEGPRFQALHQQREIAEVEAGDALAWAFGNLGVQDRAKFLASLFIDDLSDVIREGIDPKFELSRYGEKLAASAPLFDPLRDSVEGPETLVDRYLAQVTSEIFEKSRPDFLGLTVPFPGNVYGALRIAKQIKKLAPRTIIALGGGYVNTELRELKDPRIFDYVDFITLDDGERPLLDLFEHLEGKRPLSQLMRTYVRENGKVSYKNGSKSHDVPHRDSGTPTYDGMKLDQYLSLFEMLNPMHRIWSDGRWNKLTLAHGCYWKKCNFCDVNLDYIGRYDPAAADLLVDRIEALIKETGNRGFHFVDEAAPPAILKAMAQKLIERGVTITWWGNIRFEKTFTPELTKLLARSGCVAVSGGLEVASDRLLKLMQKGVTVEQVAQVTRAFTEAGVMVHAYLMYGFPTQTAQETIDALERVRQLFAEGCIQSAYWHRFSATAHSPIGRNPEKFGIKLLPEPEIQFARNDLQFIDPTGCDHEALGYGLRKALYNYMHGLGLESDVRVWFDEKLPKSKVPKTFITKALRAIPNENAKNISRL